MIIKLPPTFLYTSYLPLYLLPPFLPPTSYLLPPTYLLPISLLYLTLVEKSAISVICPIISIYKMGTSRASSGHTTFQQDISVFAHILLRIPEELPVVVLKSPNETITDKSFLVRRDKLIAALQFLKKNNKDIGTFKYPHRTHRCIQRMELHNSSPKLTPLHTTYHKRKVLL